MLFRPNKNKKQITLPWFCTQIERVYYSFMLPLLSCNEIKTYPAKKFSQRRRSALSPLCHISSSRPAYSNLFLFQVVALSCCSLLLLRARSVNGPTRPTLGALFRSSLWIQRFYVVIYKLVTELIVT